MRTHAAPNLSLLALLGLAGLAGVGGGCAQILGYDGLSAREGDASVDAPSDTLADVVVDAVDASDAADAAPTGPIQPPLRPAGLPQQASGKGKKLTIALRRLYLGTQNHFGAFSSTAWREWGYDLDGQCTDAVSSKQSLNTCIRVDGSADDVLVDGDRCRDNNFGSQIMGLVTTFNMSVESNTTISLQKGTSTLAFVLADVDDGSDDGYAPGALYTVASLPDGTLPAWDGTDVRQVTSDSVQNLDLSQPVVSFPKGYIAGNVWVSGDGDSFDLPFGLGGTALVLPLTAARITIPLDAAHATASDLGVLGGALPMSKLEDAMKPIAASAGLCPGNPLYDGLIAKMLTYPDVSVGAPNLQDPTKTCDGLSVGLGFELANIQPLTQIVPPPTPATTKCP